MIAMAPWQSLLLLLPCIFSSVLADTPANCSYESIKGTWNFYVGPGGYDNTVDCSGEFDSQRIITVNLDYPDKVTDGVGNTGFWTMVYYQGFEVVVNDMKFFAFSNYTVLSPKLAVSHCDSTLNGWAHKVDGTDWACYYGRKHFETSNDKVNVIGKVDLSTMYVKNMDFVRAINNSTKLWEATHYPELEGMTLKGRLMRAGGLSMHNRYILPPTAPVSPATRLFTATLPRALDWRDDNGRNFVSPIRNQGQCGSCYVFASMAMLESRMRLMANTTSKIFSPQDVVSCAEYAQGCDGGFPYLIAGKYAEDFGVVEESCYPYLGHDTKCEERPGCTRYRATKYEYVGGYFGNCNEDELMMNLATYGPVAVAFEVTSEFQGYKRGIFHTTGIQDLYNPWIIVNHAVLVVGYGVEDGVKYWIVKNSWGPYWGENGFFRIRRGTNELGIESMGVSSLPLMNQ